MTPGFTLESDVQKALRYLEALSVSFEQRLSGEISIETK